MKRLVLALAFVALEALPAAAIETCTCNVCRGICWDGRCDRNTYLPLTFKDFALPRQLGPNPYVYWNCPRCAEDAYGYQNRPAFTFFHVPGTHDPTQGFAEDPHIEPVPYGYVPNTPLPAVRAQGGFSRP